MQLDPVLGHQQRVTGCNLDCDVRQLPVSVSLLEGASGPVVSAVQGSAILLLLFILSTEHRGRNGPLYNVIITRNLTIIITPLFPLGKQLVLR